MKKTAFYIIIITIATKIFGLGREVALSYEYGVSYMCDAYLIATTIPTVIFGFVSAALSAGYIPMFSNILHNKGETEANSFTNNTLNIVMAICTAICFFGLIFTSPIVKIFASGFEGEVLNLTVKFTRISIIAIYFTGITTIFTGYLQVKQNYIIPSLISLPLNVLIIISIIISNSTSPLILPVGFVIATASQVFTILPFMIKNNYSYKFIFDINNKDTLKTIYIIVPVLLGISINQLNVLLDQTIASRICVGGISALSYADKITGFTIGIFVLSIVTVLYPNISKMAVENNINGFKRSLSEAITGINLFVLPMTLGTIILAEPIVSLLFGRGAFDSQAIVLTSSVLVFYSIGMIGFGLREVIIRAFYALQDTKTPMINATIGMGLKVVLNLILPVFLGISGLALATSLAAIFTTILLLVSLRKKIGSLGMKKIIISFLKILAASLLMGIVVKCSFNFTFIFGQNLSLLISIFSGAVSYLVVIYFMNIEDVSIAINMVKRKLGTVQLK